MTEHRAILYGLRLWGVFFFVDGAYRLLPQLIELCLRLHEGASGPYMGNSAWYWWFEYLARPVIETAAGMYLLWGGGWLVRIIIRRVKSDETRAMSLLASPNASLTEH
jgi:hypothetical protein